jgi:hypothetical protein
VELILFGVNLTAKFWLHQSESMWTIFQVVGMITISN